MRQFSYTVARNSAFGMAAQMAIRLLSFGFSVLIVRNLGAQDYGQYSAVLAFGAMFVFLADLGLSPYMVREVARWRDAPDSMERASRLFGNILLLRFLLSILAATLLIGTAWLPGRPPVMVGAIALGTLGLIMYSIQGTSDGMLAGFERLDLSAGSKVSYQLVSVLVGAVALLLGTGYYGLIVANLLGIAVMTVICWRGARALGPRPSGVNTGTWLMLLRASIPFGIIGFTLGLSYKFDSVLLNIFRGDAETGYYNAAYNLVFSTAMLSNVINTSLYPSLTRQAASAPQTLPAIYERALRYLVLLALPIAVGASALADQIVPFLFRAAYLPAVPALQIVIWVVPLMFVSEFLGYVVLIAGQERRAARAVVVSTCFNVALNLLIVPRYGFYGAAVMTVLTEAVLVGQYLWMLRAQMQQLDWQLILLRPLLAALAMGGLVLLLRDLPLLLNVAVGVLIYAGLLPLLGVVGKDELHFVRSLRQRAERSVAP
jgi:O-antigen/teichoic acid export membrane protein